MCGDGEWGRWLGDSFFGLLLHIVLNSLSSYVQPDDGHHYGQNM